MALDAEVGGTDSDSYVTLEQFKSYASDVGLSLNLPSGTAAADVDLEQAIRRGTIFVDGYDDRFYGVRADGGQALCWPRKDATRYDTSPIAADVVPKAVKDASCWAAAYALANPNDINKVINHASIQKERVGNISREYTYLMDGERYLETLTAVERLLKGLVRDVTRSGPSTFIAAGVEVSQSQSQSQTQYS